MLSSERKAPDSSVLVQEDGYEVRHLQLTPELVAWIWERVRTYRTLFSDLGRKDTQSFIDRLLSIDSMWFQVTKDQELVGIMFASEFRDMSDCDAHFFFFDKKPKSKIKMVRAFLRWIFTEMPTLSRVSVRVPEIYFSTKRLVTHIGFKEEGIKRRAMLIGGRWHNVTLFGLLREEMLDVRI